jgi:integrase
MSSWRVDRSRVLSRGEVQAVLADLGRRARRSRLSWRKLVIFRLACCCGLRVGELTRLEVGDVVLVGRPHLRVRGEIAKGGRSRRVPLTWDAGTLSDLMEWVAVRRVEAGEGGLVVSTRTGGRIDGAAARRSFQSACRVLGRHVTIHDGRHTFASHALAGGRSLVEVRDALGHRSVATTSLYLHLVDEDEAVGNLFAPGAPKSSVPLEWCFRIVA